MALSKLTAEEKDQIDSLKAHQRTVREHRSAKEQVRTLTDALSEAQVYHADAQAERAVAKNALLSTLQDA